MLFLKIVLKLINLEERIAFFFFWPRLNLFFLKSFCCVINGEERVTSLDMT